MWKNRRVLYPQIRPIDVYRYGVVLGEEKREKQLRKEGERGEDLGKNEMPLSGFKMGTTIDCRHISGNLSVIQILKERKKMA